MTNRKSHICFPLTPRSMTLDDIELLYGQILLEFRDISRVSGAITAKRMNKDPYCQRRNCSPLNALFSDVYRLRWYRRAFTRYGASNKCKVGKTRYFRAKCVNITAQMALTAAPLLQASRYFVCNLFSRRSGAIFGMLARRTGLSAPAGFLVLLSFISLCHS